MYYAAICIYKSPKWDKNTTDNNKISGQADDKKTDMRKGGWAIGSNPSVRVFYCCLLHSCSILFYLYIHMEVYIHLFSHCKYRSYKCLCECIRVWLRMRFSVCVHVCDYYSLFFCCLTRVFPPF